MTILFKNEEEVNTKLGITPVTDADVSWIQPQHRAAMVAINKLFNICEAHNKANNFVVDWNDGGQDKYCAWHRIAADASKPSGFGFSNSFYADWLTSTTVGSRLSVGTSEEAVHIAKTFDYLYQDLYFIIPE
jgi:hypothetical protein